MSTSMYWQSSSSLLSSRLSAQVKHIPDRPGHRSVGVVASKRKRKERACRWLGTFVRLDHRLEEKAQEESHSNVPILTCSHQTRLPVRARTHIIAPVLRPRNAHAFGYCFPSLASCLARQAGRLCKQMRSHRISAARCRPRRRALSCSLARSLRMQAKSGRANQYQQRRHQPRRLQSQLDHL